MEKEKRMRSDYRGNSITIPMTEEEREFVCQKAKEMGMTMSGYCRMVLIYKEKES